LTIQTLYQIALTLIPGVGDISAKSLLAYCGSAEAIFNEKKSNLSKIPGIGDKTAKSIVSQNVLLTAEKEISFIESNNVQPVFFTDVDYPERLKHCADGPVLLYYKGKKNLNDNHFVSIVGTRNITDYGRKFTEEIVESLRPYNVCVVSGLAYGIDISSHKAALKNKMSTVGVLAHGLDRVYPSLHTNIAREMQENGGLLTEFISGTNPDRENFPKRNRIVAGISEVTIVVEAAKKGGALITAELANSYNRDVFALPGRLGDQYSEGCNMLIKSNKACLIQSVKDIEYIMGWSKKPAPSKNIQKQLFVSLDEKEKTFLGAFEGEEKMHLDVLSVKLQIPVSKVFATLTMLELKGVVKVHPGKAYSLV